MDKAVTNLRTIEQLKQKHLDLIEKCTETKGLCVCLYSLIITKDNYLSSSEKVKQLRTLLQCDDIKYNKLGYGTTSHLVDIDNRIRLIAMQIQHIKQQIIQQFEQFDQEKCKFSYATSSRLLIKQLYHKIKLLNILLHLILFPNASTITIT